MYFDYSFKVMYKIFTAWSGIAPASGIANGSFWKLLIWLRKTNGLDVGGELNRFIELKQSDVPWSILQEVLLDFYDPLYLVLPLSHLCHGTICCTNPNVPTSKIWPIRSEILMNKKNSNTTFRDEGEHNATWIHCGIILILTFMANQNFPVSRGYNFLRRR